ncbi:cell wall hydrolase [Pullulanibacillus sp. KACC 23026]|uniref:cell wall hydrolase n=1 Tax=Pullulanibacillus sp. KACC 23026 TaxID=3028315 RepID=UPI0023B0DCDF|nr:cell wall hydrolase [Pullulanibacillus sp. KACC 23026]WEG13057.1 cell wall hydrolase [Pullulanibacillus sp. KACC 23026]
MAVIQYNESDVDLLARLMRAEAEDQGDLGELLVGNVGVNRVRADCLDFEDVRTISQMVYQSPGGFEATQHSYFYQRARENEKKLARNVLKGLRYHPAEYSLYYYRPASGAECRTQWFGQYNAGRFKDHCFYVTTASTCPSIY